MPKIYLTPNQIPDTMHSRKQMVCYRNQWSIKMFNYPDDVITDEQRKIKEEETKQRNIHQETINKEVQKIKDKFQHQIFIVEDYDYGDPESGNFSCRKTIKEANIEDVMKSLSRGLRFHDNKEVPDIITYLQEIEDFESLKSKFDEANDGGCDGRAILQNMVDFLLLKQEQERKSLEHATTRLLRKYGQTEVNLNFIRFLEDEVNGIHSDMENHDSGEQRAERYARGRHTFDQDNDYMKSHWHNNLNEIERVLSWIKTNCPLLWAQYKSKQIEQEQEQV